MQVESPFASTGYRLRRRYSPHLVNSYWLKTITCDESSRVLVSFRARRKTETKPKQEKPLLRVFPQAKRYASPLAVRRCPTVWRSGSEAEHFLSVPVGDSRKEFRF